MESSGSTKAIAGLIEEVRVRVRARAHWRNLTLRVPQRYRYYILLSCVHLWIVGGGL